MKYEQTLEEVNRTSRYRGWATSDFSEAEVYDKVDNATNKVIQVIKESFLYDKTLCILNVNIF